MKVLAFLLLFFLLQCVHGLTSGDLRLWRDGNSNQSYSYGRLQIYVGGKWGEICDDEFGKTEADVACHQLGFVDSTWNDSDSSSGIPDSFGNISDVVLSELYCPTDDYLHLLRCAFTQGRHTCNGNGYISLYCNPSRIWDKPYNGQIRLILGNYTSEGLAQIYCNGEWGTICGDSYYGIGDIEADTVCRQLGYTGSSSNGHLDLQGNYSSPIWIENINCPSEAEQCLGACGTCSSKGSSSCSHYDDLTIQCSFDTLHYEFGSNVSTCEYYEGGYVQDRPRLGEVRVTRLNSSQDGISAGIAELVYGEDDNTINKTWTRICSVDNNNKNNSDTVCAQLGYSWASSYYSVPANTSIPHLAVFCSRQQPHILWCRRNYTYITCEKSLVVQCIDNGTYYTGQVRLVGGDYPSEGRVEIYVYDTWSSMYTYYYSNYQVEAGSICRQLGYTGALSYDQGTIPGSGTIRISDPYCYSVETCFSTCLNEYDYVDNDYTTHSEDLAVNCTFDTSVNVTVGTEELCTIEEPPKREEEVDVSGLIVGVFTLVIFMLVTFCIVVIILVVCCCCLRRSKKNSRRARQRGAAPIVGYTVRGQNLFMVPAGQQPGGMMLVQGVLQAVPVTQNQEEEKNPLPSSQQITPSVVTDSDVPPLNLNPPTTDSDVPPLNLNPPTTESDVPPLNTTSPSFNEETTNDDQALL